MKATGLRAGVGLLALLLAACSSGQGDDLDAFIKDSGKDLKGKVDPLPEVKPFEAVVYNADGQLVDPFVPRKAVTRAGALQPDTERPRDPGESYPLQSLKYVGGLAQGKQQIALLKTPDKLTLEVKVGEHVGQNFGLITAITEAEIQIKEIVQDELTGEWVERQASIPLQE